MAVYKVPQDVEADDKLIGPFSFRQFIYLIIVAGAIVLGWLLSKLFLPLAVIPLPIVLFFGALALPLKKDQPMETYMAAIVSFYLKPRLRKWDPDGQQALIEIVAPKVVEVQRTKDLSQDEAARRLSYLADVVDSRGWAVRGVSSPLEAYQAGQVEDILDTDSQVGKSMNDRLDVAAAKQHQDALERMKHPQSAVTIPLTQPTAAQPIVQLQQTAATPDPQLTFNPYPTMRQSVVQPLPDQPTSQPQPPQQTTSGSSPSPDILELANTTDLSIESIAHEANRLQKRDKANDEVVISLR